jgi:hypothetical protein
MKIATYLNPLPNPLPANITKGQLAQARLGDMTFDYALPQEWLDAYCTKEAHDAGMGRWNATWHSLYEQIVCQCVTVYPPGNYFGEIVNLITGEILS